ncbi:MAG: hypothetical protein MN733_23120, partial [Nitrososphaera sp.]|nr:hypothetical protein [Nitrososphaera sp.]
TLFLQDAGWLEELEETVPVMWNWKISTEKGIKETLNALRGKNGVLIEFHQDLDGRVIRKILRQIKETFSDDLDGILFNDAQIQRIWNQEICGVHPPCEIKEKVIVYNTRLEATSAHLKRSIF